MPAVCQVYALLSRHSLTCPIVLDAFDIARLHLVSKRLHSITKDNEFWKLLCFEDSNSPAVQKRRDLQFIAPSLIQEPARVFELQRRARALSAGSGLAARGSEPRNGGFEGKRTVRVVADWDSSFLGEKIDWYDEYVARHAPISMSWLQQPIGGLNGSQESREIKGLGLLKKSDANVVLAPLDDGSVCLWNICREGQYPHPRTGAVMARSKPGVLSVDNHNGNLTFDDKANPRARMTSTGVVECISIDEFRNKAYIAAQAGLNEVDLETLQRSSHENYPLPISALSESDPNVPLTVGTTLSLHLHDHRQAQNARPFNFDPTAKADSVMATLPTSSPHKDFYRLLSGDGISEYAPLFHPGPLSILHLPSPNGAHDAKNGHIYVAGRFPSILCYDRRTFPKLTTSLHSGARLTCLSSLPYPLLCPRSQPELRPRNSHTVLAAGEYNGKGSLELYPSSSSHPNPSNPPSSPTPYRNRTSASRSKLLSATPHGTRLLFSDSDGGLKWVERDGHTLVRRWNINAYTASTSSPSSLFSYSNGPSSNDGGDVARKILPLRGWEDARGELAVWTGERVGILGFRPKARFEWERSVVEGDEEEKEKEAYAERMRRALECQANSVRFARGLGLAG